MTTVVLHLIEKGVMLQKIPIAGTTRLPYDLYIMHYH